MCDEDIKTFVDNLVAKINLELGHNLIGVYLHGSLAMGAYYRPKSDIDLIVVVRNKLNINQRKLASEMIAQHSLLRPTTGNIELSIILLKTARETPTPTPFEVHYSSRWHDKILFQGVDYSQNRFDPDLQSHFAYVSQRGFVLKGFPINEVFSKVDWKLFLDSVLDDFDWIVEDEHILETPFYCVLNICRVLQLKSEDIQQVHSKDEGGEWALRNLPKKYHSVIKKALVAYRSSKEVNESQRRTNEDNWDKQELLAFRDFARGRSDNFKSV